MKSGKLSLIQIRLLIVIVAAILFIPFTGQVHLFDWDEINFAESAREMIETGNYLEVQVDYETFWEKPPLFMWMQAISMHVFGVNEFAARFPNAICGIFTLLVLFNFGNYLYDRRFGLTWVLIYLASFFPFIYFKSGIIDPWFNLFMFNSIFYLFRYLRETKTKMIIPAAVFTGLAILTKGPVGALIPGITILVYLFFIRFKAKIRFKDVLLFFFIMIPVGGFWFLLMLMKGEGQMIIDFIDYQAELFSTQGAGHGGFLFYHFVVVFFGVFPASVFALKAFRRARGSNDKIEFRRIMLILFWVVMILFTIVKTKIIHYSSMAWFPVTFLAAYAIMNIRNRNYKFNLSLKIILGVLTVIYASFAAVLPLFDKFKHQIIEKGWIKDDFALANLKAEANWYGFEGFVGLISIAGFVIMLIKLRQDKIKNAIFPFLIASAIFVYAASLFITPRVEKYSQNAAIEFYKSKQGEDVYVYPLGFKSYAHLFYTRKQPGMKRYTEYQLLTGQADKPVYFVIKINKSERKLKEYPALELLYKKNGFVFCKIKDNS